MSNTYRSRKGVIRLKLLKVLRLACSRRMVRGALRSLIHARHDGTPVNSGTWGRREDWGLPPFSNTGVTVSRSDSAPAWAGVHWFAGTLRGLPASHVLAVLGAYLDATPAPRKTGGYGYRLSAGVRTASVYWTDGRPDVFVVLPGEVCEQLGVPALVALATELDLTPSSRLDVAWDTDLFTPLQLARSFEAGDVVTRIQRKPRKGERQDRCRGIEYRSNSEGDTVYLGSRTSQRFVRVYDRRGSTRLEMELKEERAKLLWARFLSTADEGQWSALALGVVRDFIDFKDCASAENPKDRVMLPWWAAFTAWAGKVHFIIPKQPVTLEKSRQWLKKQVAGSFAMCFDVERKPGLMVRELLALGREAYRKREERARIVHQARIDLARSA